MNSDINSWITSEHYRSNADVSLFTFLQVSDLLLERPNLNSSHLFRADILHDSSGKLQTKSQKEQEYAHRDQEAGDDECATSVSNADTHEDEIDLANMQTPSILNFNLERTIVRRLIPRKPKLDSALVQSCHVFHGPDKDHRLIIYVPEVHQEEDIPWYHPSVKALAYQYEPSEAVATISVHYLPFSRTSEPPPPRLHRTFLSLLQTILRLCKLDAPVSPHSISDGSKIDASSRSTTPAALKDTIIPQHLVQDTYTRLKQDYAPDLIARWVEKTEPSKHVFEDLSIAAFLIELWKSMYPDKGSFPGFIDMACGNGILVYVLTREGYSGSGFDARHRKSWDMLGIDGCLEEKICIPQPFIDAVGGEDVLRSELQLPLTAIHNGIVKPDIFIISNHADELTPWTPILASLSNPTSPLPFLAIPCCSHALSGSKHRYTPQDIQTDSEKTSSSSKFNPTTRTPSDQIPKSQESAETEPQPNKGDLKSLRAQKIKASTHRDDKSQYACLTRKVASLAEELNFEVELTLMRIPSTRNIGVVGNRLRATRTHARRHVHNTKHETQTRNSINENDEKTEESSGSGDDAQRLDESDPINTHQNNSENNNEANKVKSTSTIDIQELINRECNIGNTGGLKAAAHTWINRAKKLQVGQGRGKVNLGRSLSTKKKGEGENDDENNNVDDRRE